MNSTSREEKIRSKVVEILPELDEIHDGFLRGQVIEAWVYSLSNSSFNSIDEIRASGNADSPAMKCGTQTDHIRGVTRIAMVLGDDMIKQFPQLPINRDLLIACPICHDVGKPYEFDPKNQKRWKEDSIGTGYPAIRHPQYGTPTCLTVGLPEEVCHAAGCHSGEGELVQRSLHVTIVHHADYVWWATLKAGDQMELE